MRFRHQLLLTLLAGAFAILGAAGVLAAESQTTVVKSQPRWRIGSLIATYAGPSHANVLTHVNNMMLVMQSEDGYRFDNFGMGTPLGLRLLWSANDVVSFSGTYNYSQYTAESFFDPYGWDSDRSLTTKLHEFTLGLQYGLQFVRSQKIEPYVGFAMNYAYADSKLAIELVNPGYVYVAGSDEVLMPNQSFEVSSSNGGLGVLAMAGLSFHLTGRLLINAEIQGVMGQIRQYFDYDGSLQYIEPTPAPADVENPGINDILLGAYPLDLNGIRLSVGVLLGI